MKLITRYLTFAVLCAFASANAQSGGGYVITAMVNKFKCAPSAQLKARVLLAGDDAFGNINTINLDVGFGHIAAGVDALRGRLYPHTIQSCL